ncbi:MAG: DUF4251 domain-containing protein [Winogradskyella sp.]
MKHRTPIVSITYTLAIIVSMLAISCKPSESMAERTQALSTLETKINNKNFKIDINTVIPFNTNATTQVLNNLMRYTGNTANRITVNGYYITFKNDSISGYLPYYGEQELSSNRYNTDLGIEFSGIPQEYSLDKLKRKDAYLMKFTINDQKDTVETYRVFITFFPSNTADVNIVTSHRNGISYRGQLEAVE